jgi:hypothetical protein
MNPRQTFSDASVAGRAAAGAADGSDGDWALDGVEEISVAATHTASCAQKVRRGAELMDMRIGTPDRLLVCLDPFAGTTGSC